MIARSVERIGPEVVVIGAGPYGLAVASHLRARGVATRSFGEPMSFWRRNMPKGMTLRSPLVATDISDPDKALSLPAYARSQGAGIVEALPIATFIDYGMWFQSRAVPDLDRRRVARVEAVAGGFRVATDEGEAIFAKRVVVAAGLANHQFRPPVFASAPASLVTHTSDHDDLDVFHGKRVAVIGRGQSACETAALLSETGAEVEVLCRGPIHWLGVGKPRGELRRRLSAALRAPSAVGPFPLDWLVEVPSLARLLPRDARAAFNAASLRAGAAGWLLPRFADVKVTSGVEVVGAAFEGHKVRLTYRDGGSADFDHVILATGYRFDVARLEMLAPELRSTIASRAGSPVLSAGFESSAPGLHIVGAGAVASLGPLMRFIAGTEFTARSVTRAIVPSREARNPRVQDRVEYDLTA